MEHPAPRAELLFDHGMDADTTAGMVAEFRRLGFVTEVRTRLPHRGPDEITWLMLAALPLQAFLSGIGAEAVKDVYARAKRLTTAGKKARNDVPLVLQDAETELKVILEADLPPEAIRQLVGLDLGAFRTGPLHYDRAGKKWRSELDEAEG
jgi:hypothetical protein